MDDDELLNNNNDDPTGDQNDDPGTVQDPGTDPGTEPGTEPGDDPVEPGDPEEPVEPEEPAEPTPFTWEVLPVPGLPEEWVEYVPYPVIFRATSGSGIVQLTEAPDYLLGAGELKAGVHLTAGEAEDEESYTTILMMSQCRAGNQFIMEFESTNDATPELDPVKDCLDITIVTDNEEYPFYGVRLTWEKQLDAAYYVIRAEDPEIPLPEEPAKCQCVRCSDDIQPSLNEIIELLKANLAAKAEEEPSEEGEPDENQEEPSEEPETLEEPVEEEPEEPQRFRTIIVPNDTYSRAKLQWFLDRKGTPKTLYTISAMTADGVEGQVSPKRHAPDIFSDLCLVQGTIASIGAEPSESIPLVYRIKEPTRINNTFIRKGTNLLYTDERGYFEFFVPRKCIINLIIDDVGFNQSLVIPDQEYIDIEELLKLPQNLPGGKYVQ